MTTAKERVGRQMVAFGLLISLISLVLGVTTSPAFADTPISAHALTEHSCDDAEWHFVITQTNEIDAPASILVQWANGASSTVDLDGVTGSIAHYATTANLESAVTAATASIVDGWNGQFNLSHGPCGDTKVVHMDPVPVVPELPVVEDGTCRDPDGVRIRPSDTAIIHYEEGGDVISAKIVADGYVLDREATLAAGYNSVSEDGLSASVAMDDGIYPDNPIKVDPDQCKGDEAELIVPKLPYFEDGNCSDLNGDRQLPRDDRTAIDYRDGGDVLVAVIVEDGYRLDTDATLAIGYDSVSEDGLSATLDLENGIGVENPVHQDPAECEPTTTVEDTTATSAPETETQPTDPEDQEPTTNVDVESASAEPEDTTTTTIVGPIETPNTTVPPVTVSGACDADNPAYDEQTGLCALPFTGPNDALIATGIIGVLATLAGAFVLRTGRRMESIPTA